MKAYRFLLLDADGTLLDFDKDMDHAFRATYETCFSSQRPFSQELLDCYETCNSRWWQKLERGECTKPQLVVARFVDFLRETGLSGDPEEILDIEGLAASLLELLMELYPNAINTRYKTDISPEDHLPGHELLERVGRKRGMLISGGEVNTERAAITVLDEYRGGKLGRITLERP